MNKKHWPNYAGLIGYSARNRQTGTPICVFDGAAAGLDTDEGRAPYSTVCEEHGTVICHATKRLAFEHSRDPQGWCELCRQKLDGRTKVEWWERQPNPVLDSSKADRFEAQLKEYVAADPRLTYERTDAERMVHFWITRKTGPFSDHVGAHFSKGPHGGGFRGGERYQLVGGTKKIRNYRELLIWIRVLAGV